MPNNPMWSNPQSTGNPRGQSVRAGQGFAENDEEAAAARRAAESGGNGLPSGSPEQMPELVAQLIAQKQAGAELTGMDAQLMRAAKLRDKEYNAKGKYTTGGIGAAMGGMANYLDRSRGEKEYGQLSGEMDVARSKIAEGEAQGLARAMKRQDASDQMGQDKWAAQQAQQEVTNERADAKVARDTVTSDRDYALKKAQAAAGGGAGTGSFRGKVIPQNYRKEYRESGKASSIVRRMSDNFSPDVAQAGGVPTGKANELLRGAAASGLGPVVDKFSPGLSDKVETQRRFVGDWQKYVSLKELHDQFGAAVTKPEQKLFKLAQGMEPGQDPDVMEQRLSHIADVYEWKNWEMWTTLMLGQKGMPNEMASLGFDAEASGLTMGEDGMPLPPMDEDEYDSRMERYYGESAAEFKAGQNQGVTTESVQTVVDPARQKLQDELDELEGRK